MSGANEEDVEKDEEEYNDADDVDEEMTELGIEFAKEEDEVDPEDICDESVIVGFAEISEAIIVGMGASTTMASLPPLFPPFQLSEGAILPLEGSSATEASFTSTVLSMIW